MTISNCSGAVVIPAADVATAEAIAEQQGRLSPQDNFIGFYNVPLSSTGQLPATHYGCHTHCRRIVVDNLPAVSSYIPDSRYVVTRLDNVKTGSTFMDLISEMGLQIIENEI